MSHSRFVLKYFFIILCFSFSGCLVYCVDVWGSEVASGNFRSNYDIIMKWVNFFIMVIIFFKYAYNPLKQFIRRQKNDVESQITALEERKNVALLELKEVIKSTKESEIRLNKLKNSIISEGERKCNIILEKANEQSIMMMKDARRKAESRLLEARKMIKHEIVEIAVKLAEEKLHLFVDNDYNTNLLNNYIKSIE